MYSDRSSFDKTMVASSEFPISSASPMPSSANSSVSPTQSSTPPRTGRLRNRYGDIGHVPLHRRGNSNTYETLEDLLKEAGFKETRVFTPEDERRGLDAHVRDKDSNSKSTMREGVGAVVGFLAGLMPGVSASRSSSRPPDEDRNDDRCTYSPLLSPSIYGQRSVTPFIAIDPPSASTIINLTEAAHPTLLPSLPATQSYLPSPQVDSPSRIRQHRILSQRPSYASERQLIKQVSRSSLRLPPAPPTAAPFEQVVQPRPSRAGMYLRHMVSTPNMPPRPSSTPARNFSRRNLLLPDQVDDGLCSLYCRKGNGEGEEEKQPPLPRTWLGNVARAVLFGGPRSYIGGPLPKSTLSPPSKQVFSKAHTLRPTRSSLSQASGRRRKASRHMRAVILDSPNPSPSKASLAPPTLFTQIERGRAGRSEGEVCRMRVVCRSAPGSRVTSPVRGLQDGKDRMDGSVRKVTEWDRTKKVRDGKNRVPSLARTHAEGDIWAKVGGEHRTADESGSKKKFYSAWGMEPDTEEGGDCSEGQLSTASDDDGELDLARILVPPKRHNSIKSLRKHLGSETTDVRTGRCPANSNRRLDRGETNLTDYAAGRRVTVEEIRVDGWANGLHESRQIGSGNEEEESGLGIFGEGRRRTSTPLKNGASGLMGWGFRYGNS